MFRWLRLARSLRFALEARPALSVRRELLGQKLDRDVALEPRVAGAINLAHPADADEREDLVRTEARSEGFHHLIPTP